MASEATPSPRRPSGALAMNFDQQRLITGLILSATALFLIAVAPGFPYRRAARRVSIAIYVLTVAIMIGLIVLWLLGVAV
jgi:uncharacterized membrane protein